MINPKGEESVGTVRNRGNVLRLGTMKLSETIYWLSLGTIFRELKVRLIVREENFWRDSIPPDFLDLYLGK